MDTCWWHNEAINEAIVCKLSVGLEKLKYLDKILSMLENIIGSWSACIPQVTYTCTWEGSKNQEARVTIGCSLVWPFYASCA